MDERDLISIFLKGVLGRGGRKRARRTAEYITGHRGFLSASTLLAAAGVAWGVYDSVQGQGAATLPTGAAATSTPPLPAMASGTTTSASPSTPPAVLRIVRLAISAAHADGTLVEREQVLILEHARRAGVEHLVAGELAQPKPLPVIVAGLASDTEKRELYMLAFAIVRADETVSGAERVYLAQLAHLLGIDATTAAALEQETAARIDAAPDGQ